MSHICTVKIETGKPLLITDSEGFIVMRLFLEKSEWGLEMFVDMDTTEDVDFCYSSIASRRIEASIQECPDPLPR